MTYKENIPEFAMQPARAADEPGETAQINDGFDPTPYDRLLVPADRKAAPPDEKLNQEPEQEKQQKLEEKQKAEEESEQEKESAEPVTAEERPEPVIFSDEPPKEAEIVKVSEPVTVTPLEGSAVYSDLKVNTICQKLETDVFIEEDILVPDIKPDLASILIMDGKAYLSSKDMQIGQDEGDHIRVTGEIALQTIYLPAGAEDNEPVSMIQSRLPFKTDWQVSASPMSHITILPTVEKVEYSVINERKFRAKVTLKLALKEYAEKEFQFFDSLRNEKLEVLKEKVRISHIAARKEESVEISEDLKIKENGIKPVKILKTDISAAENHKQITAEKIVLNASVLVNVLYMGEEEKDGETILRPAFFQGKTDFTQFVLVNKEENISNIKISFNEKDLEVKIDEDEEGFNLSGNVNTSIEINRNLEKEIVSDLYHGVKDMTYDFSEKKLEAVVSAGMSEVSAREIFHIPEAAGPVGKVIYVNGRIKEKKSAPEQGRASVNGIIEAQILCLPEDEGKRPFTVKQDIPFRGSMDLPDSGEDKKLETSAVIKDLWFDRINGKQVEVNASLQIETAAVEEKTIKLIKNPCFVEGGQAKRPAPMVIYITKEGDTLWTIAKKYKTGIEAIREINKLEENAVIKEGMKLLIVK
ncbi:DUF3794 domain-containing protein [bacterium 210820-DFI.6.37]|nr:DUF3794 domain-containing protein [bacterium 210820-DFI.6.37]